MNAHEQMLDIKKTLDGVLDRWCPEFSRKSEPYQNQMMRALLNLHAFELDYKLVMEGRLPIRTDYPLPLPGSKPSPYRGA